MWAFSSGARLAGARYGWRAGAWAGGLAPSGFRAGALAGPIRKFGDLLRNIIKLNFWFPRWARWPAQQSR